MQLAVLKDRLEEWAERNISDPAFLLACAQVIRLIEARSYKTVDAVRVSLDLVPGTDTYDIGLLGVQAQAVLEIWYAPTGGRAQLLLPVDAFPPVSPQIQVSTPTYYSFIDNSTLLLDAQRGSGSLLIRAKAFVEPLEETLGLSTEVSYPPLFAGLLALLGRSVWEDSRAETWSMEFEGQLKAFTRNAERRASKIRNLLDRYPTNRFDSGTLTVDQ